MKFVVLVDPTMRKMLFTMGTNINYASVPNFIILQFIFEVFVCYYSYHHGHFIIWQGVSFPDGMVVIEGPEPGFMTDTMVWRDCQTRGDIEVIMQSRIAENPPRRRLKLYADKIYNTCPIITAAFSRRHGQVLDWMTAENFLMSKVRVAIEWTFGTASMLWKFFDYRKTQKIDESPIAKHYTVAVLLSNCRCCVIGDQHTEYFNCLPPTLEDYLSQ